MFEAVPKIDFSAINQLLYNIEDKDTAGFRMAPGDTVDVTWPTRLLLPIIQSFHYSGQEKKKKKCRYRFTLSNAFDILVYIIRYVSPFLWLQSPLSCANFKRYIFHHIA